MLTMGGGADVGPENRGVAALGPVDNVLAALPIIFPSANPRYVTVASRNMIIEE